MGYEARVERLPRAIYTRRGIVKDKRVDKLLEEIEELKNAVILLQSWRRAKHEHGYNDTALRALLGFRDTEEWCSFDAQPVSKPFQEVSEAPYMRVCTQGGSYLRIKSLTRLSELLKVIELEGVQATVTRTEETFKKVTKGGK